jgi:hypothetical protein
METLKEFNTRYKLSLYFKPILTYIDFEHFLLEKSNEQVAQLYQEICNLTYVINGENQYRGCYVTNIYGAIFSWSYYLNGNLNVWDSTGATLIANVDLPVRDPKTLDRAKAIRKATRQMEEFTSGWIHCSHCDEKVKYVEVITNRHWAGIYCNTCWEREYKAKEAKENYN